MVRRATRADYMAFFGKAEATMWALAGEVDGKIVGIGGLAHVNGRQVLFLDIAPEARRYKVTLMREAKKMMDAVKASGRAFVYAKPDPKEPAAAKWLRSLGFAPTEGGYWLWRA